MDQLNREIINWDNSDVLNWLSELNLSFLSETFGNSQITGYDLCLISQEELKSELGINSINQRNTIMKSIKLHLLNLMKINVKFEDKSVDIQLDLQKSTKVEDLIILLREVFKLNDTNKTYLSTNSNEVLSRSCNLFDLILLNPENYKYLNLVGNTSSNKNQLSKYSNENLEAAIDTKYKKYSDVPPQIPSNQIESKFQTYDLYNTKDNLLSKPDYKFNKENNDNSFIKQKMNNSIENSAENKKNEKFIQNESSFPLNQNSKYTLANDKYEKYTSNSNNSQFQKDYKPISIADDYKIENSFDADKKFTKAYDKFSVPVAEKTFDRYSNINDKNYDKYTSAIGDKSYEKYSLGGDNSQKYGFKKNTSDKTEKYEKYEDLLNDNNNSQLTSEKLINYNSNVNDELSMKEDKFNNLNQNNPLKYENKEQYGGNNSNLSQKHSPLRSGTNLTNDKQTESKYDYLLAEREKSAKNRYFSSEKRVFRNNPTSEKDNADNYSYANQNDDKESFKSYNNPALGNYENKNPIPSELKSKIDSMRNEFNDTIKRFQSDSSFSKKNYDSSTNNINPPISQVPQSNFNEKRLPRNASGFEKKK